MENYLSLDFAFEDLRLTAIRGPAMWECTVRKVFADGATQTYTWTDVQMGAVLALMASGDETPLFDEAWKIASTIWPDDGPQDFRLIP